MVMMLGVLIFMLAQPTTAMAITENEGDYPNVDIRKFLLDNNLDVTIKEIIPLLDSNDSVVAFLHLLKPTGYII